MIKNILKISTFVFFFTLLFPLHSFAEQKNILSQLPTNEEIKKQVEENLERAKEQAPDTGETYELFEEKMDELDTQREEIQGDIEDISRMVDDAPVKNIEDISKMVDDAPVKIIKDGIVAVFGSIFVFIGILIFFGLIAFGGVILNIIMLIDCNKREFPDKTLWIVILVAGTLMGFGIIP
ncbi:MAG TPA: hypothetical protein P5344_03390, partial [Candidatus Dojkabacteria bacterium]|nr:hypothetical protein [Candidatus Dojkabacteria bacterium]